MRTLRTGALLTTLSLLLAACGGGGGGGNGKQAAFCNTLKKGQEDKTLSSIDPGNTAQQAKSSQYFDKLASDAPSEISSDVKVFQDAMRKFSSGDGSFQQPNQQTDAATKKLDTALYNIKKYSKDKCKLDLSSG